MVRWDRVSVTHFVNHLQFGQRNFGCGHHVQVIESQAVGMHIVFCIEASPEQSLIRMNFTGTARQQSGFLTEL